MIATKPTWINASICPPGIGKLVRVMYEDGMETTASREGGEIYYPLGSSVYRYCNVVNWRELTADERAAAR